MESNYIKIKLRILIKGDDVKSFTFIALNLEGKKVDQWKVQANSYLDKLVQAKISGGKSNLNVILELYSEDEKICSNQLKHDNV